MLLENDERCSQLHTRFYTQMYVETVSVCIYSLHMFPYFHVLYMYCTVQIFDTMYIIYFNISIYICCRLLPCNIVAFSGFADEDLGYEDLERRHGSPLPEVP